MRLNPLDPQIHNLEHRLARANFYLRQFETASSWAAKAMARQKNYDHAIATAMVSYAMLGRVADAQSLFARRREAGWVLTISEIKKRLAFMRREEDVELYLEACRIAGATE
jgi:hypothetical protein